MNRCFKVSVLFAVILILAFSVCAVDEIGNITYAPSAGGDPNVCIVSDVKMPVLMIRYAETEEQLKILNACLQEETVKIIKKRQPLKDDEI